jgi:protein SPT2
MAKIGDLLSQITGEPSPTTNTFATSPRRKPDDELRRSVDKVQKAATQPASSSRHADDLRRATAVDSKTRLSANGHRVGSATTFKNGQPTPPPSNDAPKVPKKGSYAEIMARGQAVQKILGQVGKIQHKKIEKLPSRREREDMTAQRAAQIRRGLNPHSKFQKLGQTSLREGVKESKKGTKTAAEPVPEKKIKKAAFATTGYAGTARPKPEGSMRSSRPTTGSSSRLSDRYDRGRSGFRHSAYVDEDEDEGGEEEEMDYETDVSDMEAAAFEVDEEEETAARIARREDAEALAEENRLKREKAEKKRRLMAMAKKAKPMSY